LLAFVRAPTDESAPLYHPTIIIISQSIPPNNIGSRTGRSSKQLLRRTGTNPPRPANKHAHQTLDRLPLGVGLAHVVDADHLDIGAVQQGMQSKVRLSEKLVRGHHIERHGGIISPWVGESGGRVDPFGRLLAASGVAVGG